MRTRDLRWLLLLAFAGAGCAAAPTGTAAGGAALASRAPAGAATSPQLAGAEALYDRGDYLNATLILGAVLTAGGTDADRQRAEFVMGKALFQMELRAAALLQFEEIARAGRAHRYHTASLPWLAALLVELPPESDLVDLLGTYDPAIVDHEELAASRDELRYLFGRRALHRGELEEAARLLAGVAPESRHHAAAGLLEGVVQVARRDPRRARAAFTRAIAAAQRNAGRYHDGDRLARLGLLQLARLAYSVGDHRRAIDLYDRMPAFSAEWGQALFESSWAHLVSGIRRAKALGNLFSLRTSYFDPDGYPEAMVLEALIYHARCHDDRAVATARRWRQRYRPLRQELSALAAVEDDAELHARTRTLLAEPPADRRRRALARALEDRATGRAIAWTASVADEIARVKALDPSWRATEVGIGVEQRLALYHAFSVADTGRMIRRRLQSAADELRRLEREIARIEFDALERQADEVHRRALGGARLASAALEPVPMDDEHHVWRVDDAIWRDEVGSLYLPLRDLCPVD